MEFKTVSCFFEQSGTFKNEFKNLGFNAFDFDIQDDFKQTDNVVDLFKQIHYAYIGQNSLFDLFDSDDLIIAFFPCIRFESQINLWFRGDNYSQRNWSDFKKIEYCNFLEESRYDYYRILNEFVWVCLARNIKLIIENPYSNEHYLYRYWCFKPALIDYDRRKRGDYFKKPTQYFFFNCSPSNNIIFEQIPDNTIYCKDAINRISKIHVHNLDCDRTAARSLISPFYANRFIREFIL